MEIGLVPGSIPNWFLSPAPYVMLSKKPWPELGDVVLEISDPRIKEEYFIDAEGLRWPYVISPKHIQRFS